MKSISMAVFTELLDDVVVKADKEVGRNGFRTLHSNYVHGYIDQADFYSGLFSRVNISRTRIGLSRYTASEFDHAWQYRNPGTEQWSDARHEIINLIIGWF